MKLSFVIPFRDADGTRTRTKDWILARWAHFYPDAEFCIASDDGVDPFNKSMAVNAAAKKATGDVFVILDADTWIEPEWMEKAFHQLGKYPWVIPARRSYRLTKPASDEILALPPDAELPRIINKRSMVEQSGGVVGFCHVVPREGFEMVGGMDERFRGWGGEDHCFVRALDVVWGAHTQLLGGVVVSLWHDRPRNRGRYWVGQTQEHHVIRRELAAQYTKATTPEKMLAVRMSEPRYSGNPEAVAR